MDAVIPLSETHNKSQFGRMKQCVSEVWTRWPSLCHLSCERSELRFGEASFIAHGFQNAKWNHLSQLAETCADQSGGGRLLAPDGQSLTPSETPPSLLDSGHKTRRKSSIWRAEQRSPAQHDWQQLIKPRKHSAWNLTLPLLSVLLSQYWSGLISSLSSSLFSQSDPGWSTEIPPVAHLFSGSRFRPQPRQIRSLVPAGCGGEHRQANSHWIQSHSPHHHSGRRERVRHQP